MSYSQFTARVITGSGRGKDIGSPTMNLQLSDVPENTKEGIYAGWVKIDERWKKAAIHYGPRLVFKGSVTFEVFVLDETIEHAPEALEVLLTDYVRPVQDFPSVEALQEQISSDVAQARAMLDKHGPPQS